MRVLAAAAFATVTLLPGLAQAQTRTLDLWPGVAPGSERWTQKEATYKNTPVGTVVMNVVKPTLTAYLPVRAKATGAAVIIAPGGYCVALAMSKGGDDVALWLQQRGVAAFVLKYRTLEKRTDGIPRDLNMDEACKFGTADAIQALKVLRQHAAELGIVPGKIGIAGFSAGGMVTAGTLLQQDAAARPDFAAFIYGAPFGVMPPVPGGLPPVFMAWAQDDPIALDAVSKFYEQLRASANKPEAHIFASGGHGFGIAKQGKSSDHWIDDFYFWLQSRGFVKGPLDKKTLQKS